MVFPKNDSRVVLVLFPVLLIFLNLGVKGLYLANNSLGGDEPFSVYIAQMDVGSIIHILSAGNNPPLYEIGLHYWIQLAGISEFAVRLPSLIFSCVTLFFIYRLAIKQLNARIALYASILFIFSNYHILFSHEARVYSLLGMLTVMTMFYFLESISISDVEKETTNNSNGFRGKMNFILLIVLNTLLIYAHYFGFFVLLAQILFVLIHAELRLNYWKQLLMGIGAVILLYTPNIATFFTRFTESAEQGTWVSEPNGAESIYNMLWAFSNAPLVTVVVIILFVIALVRTLYLGRSGSTSIPKRLIVFWFTFIFVFMFTVSYITPMFMDRYLMPAAIAFCLLLGMVADEIVKQEKYRYVLPAIICILFIATVKPNLTNKRNVRETVLKTEELMDQKTLMLICPHDFVLNYVYYYDKELFRSYNSQDLYANIDEGLRKQNIYAIDHIEEVDYSQWDRIIYLDAAADFSQPGNDIASNLNIRYSLIEEFEFYEIFQITLYKGTDGE